jgi:quercetin dioxygenase-like cupin family protein
MPPHSHPRAERVTVLSGTIHVGFGTSLNKSSGETFTAGDYYVNAPGAVHYVWADGPVEIQITGMGPWEIHPLE